jgi:predicted N-acetyltransferase YhbS
MEIRHENPADADAIYQLTLSAFEPMFFSDGSEAPLVHSCGKPETLPFRLLQRLKTKLSATSLFHQ